MEESGISEAIEDSGEDDDLGQMLAEIAADPIARAGYEDSLHREELLGAMVAARGNLAQKAVAAAMGTTQSAVSDIENGRVDPRLSTLQRYARAVERRIEVTLRGEDVANPSSEGSTETSQSAEQAEVLEAELKEARQQVGEHILDDIVTDLYREEPKSGPQTSAAVAKRTGLPEPSVGHTMLRLKDTGWLNIARQSQSHEPRFSLSAERGLMIGVSLGRDHVDGVLTSLRTTRVLAQRKRPIPNTSPVAVIRAVADLVRELRREAGQGREIIGLGVALAGRVDGPTGTVFFSPDLSSDEQRWIGVSLEADLEEAIREQASDGGITRVVVENDANALGMYEYLQQGEDESVCVVLISESGEGIGAGFVINRAIAHGAGGVSGEIGHIIVTPDGEPCRCGGRGCLEAEASAAAIVKKISQTSGEPVTNLKAASALAKQGHRAATEVFASAGEALGRVLASVSAIVGPKRLVIFGAPELTLEPDLASAREFLAGARRTHGQSFLSVKVNIVPRVLNHDTLSEAAAATAVHYFLSRPQHWVPTIAGPETLVGESLAREKFSVGSLTR
jgi:predicted NBD/HSP70 family sugar kinase/transcriptional regulator with XRE-family HTH domain